jgi:hypothetical protein
VPPPAPRESAPRPLAETPGAAEVRPTTSTVEWNCGACGKTHRAGDPACAPAGGPYEIVERARLHMERTGQAWPSAITAPLLAALSDMVAEAAARARRALAETDPPASRSGDPGATVCAISGCKPCECGRYCSHTVPNDTPAEHHCDDCCRAPPPASGDATPESKP